MFDSQHDTVKRDNLIADGYPVETGAMTIAQNQDLARGAVLGKVLYGAVSAAPDGGNTGDGTCTELATLGGKPLAIVGDYVLTCVEAVTNGGVFDLVDPNGNIVATGLRMTVGAGGESVFKVGGITFKLTDGATDFVAGDSFTITVAAGSEQGLLLDKDAVDGSQQFEAVLAEAVETGAGETQLACVFESGGFQTQELSFASGTTYADVKADARDKNCYFKTSFEDDNVVGG